MLNRKNLSQNKVVLMGAIIAVVWVAIGVLIYKNFFSNRSPKPSTSYVPNFDQLPEKGAVTDKKTEVTPSQFFTRPAFTELMMFGELPLTTGPLGRSNPFEPIGNEQATQPVPQNAPRL